MNSQSPTVPHADLAGPGWMGQMQCGAGQRRQGEEPKPGSAEEPEGRRTGAPGRDLLPRWEHFDHGADIGVRGIAQSEAGAFEQAALALTAVVTDPALVVDRETVQVECEAADHELLLAAWLNAVVTEMALRGMLFSRFQVDLHGSLLRGAMAGEQLSRERHAPAVEVKGATYTELRVRQLADGSWMAQTVVDV